MLLDRIRGFGVARAATACIRLANPSCAWVFLRDSRDWRRSIKPSRQHLDATMEHLCAAHDQCGRNGVSAGYSLYSGWLAAYPETTGYIIPTFYDYAQFCSREEFRERAERMARWEVDVQLPSGAVRSGIGLAEKPAIFNTGQVIFGWCRAYRETCLEMFLAAAKRAGDWLVRVQSEDGSWCQRDGVTGTTQHAYDARTAWALLELASLTNASEYRDAAYRQLDWVLSQQQENGFFQNNSFYRPPHRWALPFTHTIAYVLEGLLGAWNLLNDKRYLRSALNTAEKLMRIFELRRYMPGQFDANWNRTTSFSCLTGDAQIAAVWLSLFQITGDARYLSAALKLNDFVKSTQSLNSLNGGIRGGVKGSHPIYGAYTPFVYPNWAAKFLADSLMLEEQTMNQYEKDILSGAVLPMT